MLLRWQLWLVMMDPLSPEGPLAAAVTGAAQRRDREVPQQENKLHTRRMRSAASTVMSQMSGLDSLAMTDRPGSRAAELAGGGYEVP